MSLLGPDGKPAPFESLATLTVSGRCPAGAAEMAERAIRRQALALVADRCGYDPVTLWFQRPRITVAGADGTATVEVRLNIVAERAAVRYGAPDGRSA